MPEVFGMTHEKIRKQWDGVGLFSHLDKWTVNDTSATAVLNTWSRTANWEMTADEYEIKTQPAVTTTSQIFDFNKSFRVDVPGDAAAATLYISVDGSTTIVEAGKDSSDGKVICQAKASDGTGGFSYQYVVKAPPVPTNIDGVINNVLKFIH